MRGGLFRDNGEPWGLKEEIEFLRDLKSLLDSRGFQCRFFTNGSTLDNNALLFLEQTCCLSKDHIAFVDSVRELVETISGFDAVVAFRMHASIISCSFGIPAVNIVWNNKIPLFYNAIGRPEAAVSLNACTPEHIADVLSGQLENGRYCADPAYLMSVYQYLYETLAELFGKSADAMYPFEKVTDRITAMQTPENDLEDAKIKIIRGRNRYFSLFMKSRDREAESKQLKVDIRQLKDTQKQLQEERAQLKAECVQLKAELKQKKDEIKRQKEIISKPSVQFVLRFGAKHPKLKSFIKSIVFRGKR